MKKFCCALLVAGLLLLSGCFSSNTTPSKEEARQNALECLEAHRGEMETILNSGKAVGETKWCLSYSKLGDGRYEFDLYREGFTGTNIVTGILYLPNDTPDSDYRQDEENPNAYSFARGVTDKFYLERLEKNWFFFYYEYDF